jgi:spore coat polysaccharide biosynthesis protein SpsF
MSLRPIAIIQARVGSTRLRSKVLADVCGVPMLARMIERVRAARRLAGIVVATTHAPADRAIVTLASGLGVAAFAGSERDVLDRYVRAARLLGADPVVRLTADCPLIDPELIDAVVDAYAAADPPADHTSLTGPFPDGLDVEVVRFSALEQAWREARLPSEREHVTPFVWKHPERFRLSGYAFPGDAAAAELRWTVDEPRDLMLVRAIYERLYQPGAVFGWREVLDLFRREPSLRQVNCGIVRNAGYLRALAAESTAEVP